MTIEIAGMAEAADIIGVTKSNFTDHRKKFAGEGQCPPPTAKVGCGPIWAGQDVAKLKRWAKEFAKVRVTRPPKGEKAEPPAKPAKAAPAAAKTKPAPKEAAAAPAKKTLAKRAPIKGAVPAKAAGFGRRKAS